MGGVGVWIVTGMEGLGRPRGRRRWVSAFASGFVSVEGNQFDLGIIEMALMLR